MQNHNKYHAFFHHYQGSIDFNTVNIHRNVRMYFLVSTGSRDDLGKAEKDGKRQLWQLTGPNK